MNTDKGLAQVAMKKKKSLKSAKTRLPKSSRIPKVSQEQAFSEVVAMIAAAKQQAFQVVNTTLIDLYWKVGEYLNKKLETSEWGEGVVTQLADYLERTHPGMRGFTRSNLFRMRQIYLTYRDEKKVAPMVRQLSWSHNLIIVGQCKLPEEREFYLEIATREKWGKRELERQLKGALFERVVLSPPKVAPVVRQLHPTAENILKDSYLLEFLEIPKNHSEADLQAGLIAKLKDFLIELGRDFCFVGTEYPVQVGNRDFAIDLLFFHRGLNCLVAFELKVGRFEPEHLGKLNFYLEALDRDDRKAHEQPAIGILLCANKDKEVVEYALSRSLSPTLIAEYKTRLPDKKLLQTKLHEFYAQTEVVKLDEPRPTKKASRKK